MADVVIIPCFDRPEFLYCNLSLIQRAKMADALHYTFAVDRGASPENLRIIDKFPFSHNVITPPVSPNKLTKQSNNLLHAYQDAAMRSTGYVFLIEDDVFVANDFFYWHYLVQREELGIFCSIATLNHNTKRQPKDEPEQYYVGNKTDYQSLGVCFNKNMITDWILPHYNQDYLKHPSQYCTEHFPASSIGHAYVEQDGLIRRIMEKHDLHAAFPVMPRAYHSGVYGKNRGTYQRGTLEQRIDWVIKNCFSEKGIRKNSQNEHFVFDSTPVRLQNKLIEKITKIQGDD